MTGFSLRKPGGSASYLAPSPQKLPLFESDGPFDLSFLPADWMIICHIPTPPAERGDLRCVRIYTLKKWCKLSIWRIDVAKTESKQNGRAMSTTSYEEQAQDTDPTLSGTARKLIMSALFAKRIPVGSFVSQGELVDLLGIPIHPLRDALRVLEGEGILTIHPRAGIEFVKTDMELIRTTYQYRSILECAAVRTYAEKAPAEDVEKLLTDHLVLVDDVEKNGVNENSLLRLQELEVSFHGNLIQALGNPMIEMTEKRLQNYTSLIRIDRRETALRTIRTLQEHAKVLQAIRNRDVDLAVAEMATHLTSAMHRAMGL
jgi:DNA-binding GntR family transcriptional regulator